MSTIKIAVSGTGGGVGQSVLKALYETPYEAVALDGEPLSPGLYAAPSGHRIPYASDPEYIDRLLEILTKERCSLMFAGMDAELPKLSANRALFREAGVTLVVSRPEVVDIADNKSLTTDFLSGIGLPAPLTYDFQDILDGRASLPYPYILKDKVGGYRSRNIVIVRQAADLDAVRGIDPGRYVAQEYIEGDEYTCGSVSFDGDCLGVIVMRRILRDGDTHKCFVEFNPVIEDTVRTVIRHLKPFGPLNVQLRLRDGVPYVFELNARCSGTTAARALSGFNEPWLVADYLLKGERRSFDIRQTAILRYWKEFVVPQDRLQEMLAEGYAAAASFNQL
ncbi:MAG: hypothetical protein RLY31_920 [Bacteroidota bacterium]|jgi:carbamoyl-phosphate synthase large subunit